MQMFLSTFEAMATLFIIGSIGFAVTKRKLLAQEALSAIGPLFLEVALPALGLYKILSDFDPNQSEKIIYLPFMWLVFTFAAFLLSHLFKYLVKCEFRGEFAMTLFFQNAVFIPLIILNRMYGATSTHLIDLFLFSLFYSPFFFTFNHIFFKDAQVTVRWNKIFHPVVISTIMGVVLVLLGSRPYIPSFLMSALAMVGGMAIPLLMVVVGGNIYLDISHMRKFKFKEVFIFVLIKNFVFPVIALFAIWMFSLPKDYALLLLLEAAAPPLMAVPIFAERLNKNRALVNQFIVGSLGVSVFSIPLFYWFFNFFVR